MKFMIKTLGWDRWKAEYDRALAACEAEGVPLLEIDPPAVEAAPSWTRDEAPSPSLIASRVAAVQPSGPGITPTLVPVYLPGDEAYARWRATNVQPQKQFGYVIATATVPARRPHERADARARRAGAGLQRRHGAGDDGPEPGVPLGQRRRPARAVSAAVGGQPRPRGGVDGGRRRQLPGRGVVPPGGHAVARPRPAPRGSSARRTPTSSPPPTARASRSAAARTAAASTTSRRSASRAAFAASARRRCRSTS